MLIGVAAVLLVGYTGLQALKAKTALQQVAVDFDQLSGQLTSGDEQGAQRSLASAQEHARTAVDNTQGPGWWLSGHLPQIGPNVRAVRTVAQVSDHLADGVLPDVLVASRTLQPDQLRPQGGRIALKPLREAAPNVVRAADRLAAQNRLVAGIDTGALAPQIADPVRQLQAKIDRADRLADRASRAVRLLPSMLGADGPRRYLFMFQNNAEVRATGGIPGAFATITARNGRISLGRQGDAGGTIGKFDKPPVPLTRDEKKLFGRGLGAFPQDVNFTPDFPRSAELVAGMWRASGGGRVDGVVSVDPVALSYLLGGTGPVGVPGGQQLTAANATTLLLSKVYADIPDPSQQNVYFNVVAKRVFDAVASGTGDPKGLLSGLVRSADEHRLLVWSRRPAEQDLLGPTAISGALASRATDSPDVGVFLNSAAPYKLDYYLDQGTSVSSTSCKDGRQRLKVTVTMHSSVPRHFRRLPEYVAPQVPLFGRGTIVSTIFFFAPVGGSADHLELNGQQLNIAPQRLNGRLAFVQTVALKPGRTRVVTVEMTGGKGQTGTATLRATPGVRGSGVGDVEPSACS